MEYRGSIPPVPSQSIGHVFNGVSGAPSLRDRPETSAMSSYPPTSPGRGPLDFSYPPTSPGRGPLNFSYPPTFPGRGPLNFWRHDEGPPALPAEGPCVTHFVTTRRTGEPATKPDHIINSTRHSFRGVSRHLAVTYTSAQRLNDDPRVVALTHEGEVLQPGAKLVGGRLGLVGAADEHAVRSLHIGA